VSRQDVYVDYLLATVAASPKNIILLEIQLMSYLVPTVHW